MPNHFISVLLPIMSFRNSCMSSSDAVIWRHRWSVAVSRSFASAIHMPNVSLQKLCSCYRHTKVCKSNSSHNKFAFKPWSLIVTQLEMIGNPMRHVTKSSFLQEVLRKFIITSSTLILINGINSKKHLIGILLKGHFNGNIMKIVNHIV